MPPFRHFPLNAWYAAAWDHEVGRNLLAKTIAGRPIVIYRTTKGRAVALADACWHRLAPLSMGKLRGEDEIMCGYHGICYDADGRATFMPAQETINPSATVHSYPVVERYRYVWVWTGDPALADPDLVPDLHMNDRPDVGRRRQDDPRQLQLPADHRQPDGPHPRAVRARVEHRPRLALGVRLRGHPHRPDRHGHQVDARHRAAAVLEAQPAGPVPRLRGAGRPLADHHVHGAVHGDDRRRRRQGGHRGARGRPQPGRHRHGHQHDDPGDGQHLLLPVGLRPGLVPGQAGHHHPAARGRLRASSSRTR